MADRNQAIDLAAGALSKRNYPGSLPGADAASSDATAVQAGDGDLIARAGVKLRGATAVCEKLLVEGEVEAHLRARELKIAAGGAFVGKADVVGDAEIAGRFDGALRLAGKLLIRSTGRVSGHISYGRLEIEPGGELKGRIAADKRGMGPEKREPVKSQPWRF